MACLPFSIASAALNTFVSFALNKSAFGITVPVDIEFLTTANPCELRSYSKLVPTKSWEVFEASPTAVITSSPSSFLVVVIPFTLKNFCLALSISPFVRLLILSTACGFFKYLYSPTLAWVVSLLSICGFS